VKKEKKDLLDQWDHRGLWDPQVLEENEEEKVHLDHQV